MDNLCSLETLALAERQQRLQVCENNWVRRIAVVKRMERRMVDELREEIGGQMSLTWRLVRCWLNWAGHVLWMGEERMAKRVDR